jgi:hypothetical protein
LGFTSHPSPNGTSRLRLTDSHSMRLLTFLWRACLVDFRDLRRHAPA